MCACHVRGGEGKEGRVALSHCTKRKISFPGSSNSRGRTQQSPGCLALAYGCPALVYQCLAGTCGSSTHRWGASPRNAETGWQYGMEREDPSAAAAGSTGQSKSDFWLLETLGSALTQETLDASLTGHQASLVKAAGWGLAAMPGHRGHGLTPA